MVVPVIEAAVREIKIPVKLRPGDLFGNLRLCAAGKLLISTRRAVDFANALNLMASELIGWTYDENDVPSYARVLRTKDELISLIALGDYSAQDLAEIAKAAIDRMAKKSPV